VCVRVLCVCVSFGILGNFILGVALPRRQKELFFFGQNGAKGIGLQKAIR
jgi:hypothetical protein